MPDTGGRYPLPYPDPTDPAQDGAANMQALAEAQDYANGLVLASTVHFTVGDPEYVEVVIPYGVTFSDFPTVFATCQPNDLSGDTLGESMEVRVTNVQVDEATVLGAFPGNVADIVAGVAILVMPPPA
jgi:hypothetical protein